MPKPHTKHRKAQPVKAVAAPSALYEVEMAPSAAAVYKQLHANMKNAEARGHQSSAHHTTFRMVQGVIKNVIPRDPTNKNYGLSGPLSGFFRIKKGRHRICWAACSKTRKVCIVFISETLRKDGDVNDPYRLLTRLVMSGEFDKVLGRMGIPTPPRNFLGGGAPQIQ
jgi:mRNA-degrading endonuclease RelE of RelBE toxin-antitoxin system